MTSLRQKMIRLVVVEGSDGQACGERINCWLALGWGGGVRGLTGNIWVPLRWVEMWGRGMSGEGQ